MKQESERKKNTKEDGKIAGNNTNSELENERHDIPSGLIIEKVMRIQDQILIKKIKLKRPSLKQLMRRWEEICGSNKFYSNKKE